MANDVHIYGLIDPVTMGIRYIGKAKHLRRRYVEHVRDSSNSVKAEWLRTLKVMNLAPIMVALDCAPESEINDKEREWINRGALLGWELTNTSMTSKLDIATESWAEHGGSAERRISARFDIDPQSLYDRLKSNLYRPMWVADAMVYLSRTQFNHLAAIGFAERFDDGRVGTTTTEFYFTVKLSDVPEYALMHIFPYEFCNESITHAGRQCLADSGDRVVEKFSYTNRTFFSMF